MHSGSSNLCSRSAFRERTEMNRKLLIVAVLVPVLCFLLAKYQDADMILIISEYFGKNPAVALKGKVFWITGASSGIGEYLAYELSKCGCKLVLSARRKEELERVKEKCVAISSSLDPLFKKDQDILVLPLDLVKFDTHEKLAKDVSMHFGKVDVLVHNAARGARSLIEKASIDVDRAIMDVNTFGTISLTKAVLPYMIQRQKGDIVVVSSGIGKFAIPLTSSYAASKRALQGFFDTARLELAQYNIGVQIIMPGPVKSNILENCYTENVDVLFKDTPQYKEVLKQKTVEKMPTERCARLMAVSMANNLEESWISEHPTLIFYYMGQYFPTLQTWIMKTLSPNYIGSQTSKS